MFEPSAADALAEVELEARLMQVGAQPAVRLDGREVVAALRARCAGHVLAVGEVVVLHVGGHALRLRVAQADVLDAAARVRCTASTTTLTGRCADSQWAG